MARATPLLTMLTLSKCDLRGGCLDSLGAITGLRKLSLFNCHGAAVGYAASLVLFKRSFGRPLDLSVDKSTVESMRANVEELKAQLLLGTAASKLIDISVSREGGLLCVGC